VILCENCLGTIEEPTNGVPVGHDQGSQRDPYRVHRRLCGECGPALLDGRWDVLHARYCAQRTVQGVGADA
jgi:hypothetical protein